MLLKDACLLDFSMYVNSTTFRISLSSLNSVFHQLLLENIALHQYIVMYVAFINNGFGGHCGPKISRLELAGLSQHFLVRGRVPLHWENYRHFFSNWENLRYFNMSLNDFCI